MTTRNMANCHPSPSRCGRGTKLLLTASGPMASRHGGAMTIIGVDSRTRLVESRPVMDCTSLEAGRIVDPNCFAKYPRPACCLHDQGSANGIIERVHLSIGNEMRTTTIKSPEEWGLYLANVTFALRASYHSSPPAPIAFGRDMLVDLKHHTDWEAEHQRKVRQIQQHTGCRVFVRNDASPQSNLAASWKRPFEVIAIRDNGVLTLDKGRYVEHIHKRRVRPFNIRNRGKCHA
ncbi:TPA: hypothetical protein N0F65_005075 [Lagenidium giganteum]|uniref:Uncharacterized protein n=1 Tax=Lagenidium giganteum TaxID=4803 RepID=A0AAV2YGW5_9STRA|nr:TPA: hypothetical protein N0F65_005075 [Lagenidium giganteum]